MGLCRLVGLVPPLYLPGYGPNHESIELRWGEDERTHSISVISSSFAMTESVDLVHREIRDKESD